jgi:glycosyltransferase involved in cell wall biosynthesis
VGIQAGIATLPSSLASKFLYSGKIAATKHSSIASPQMNNMPLVSVIIIFLNGGKFLRQAIESVFGQSYNHWELFLVDDGSTDDSAKIARDYTQKKPDRVHYLEHPGHQNRGMSASRNLGIVQAKGQYIAFLDADDLWLPEKLEEQVAILESRPEAGLVYGPALYWYSWTGRSEDIPRDFEQVLGFPFNTLVKPPQLLLLFLSREGTTPSPSGILVRKKVVEEVGGFENSFLGMYEDQAFYLKICLKTPVFVSGECWYQYRQHSEACVAMGVKQGEYYSARLDFLNWGKEYLSKQSINNSDIWASFKRELQTVHHRFRFRYLTMIKRWLKKIAKRILLVSFQKRLWFKWHRFKNWSLVGFVRFRSLAGVTPISRSFGFDRGQPVDRYYIEKFLAHHADDIHSRVLEIAADDYTKIFGGNRVTKSDVLHLRRGNPKATIVADLTKAEHLPGEIFDCIILTQTLHVIYDFRAALQTLYRILKPGGVLLATFPGISQISRYDMEHWGDYWRFTSLSTRRIFEEVFSLDNVTIETYGNVVAAIAFLEGVPTKKIGQKKLDYRDSDYEVLITVRAVKILPKK